MMKSTLSLTAALPAILLTGIAHAAEPGRYEMTTYRNGAGSAEVLAGRYSAAIEAASTDRNRGNREDRLIAATNLCVAHTVQRELSAAYDACSLALKRARATDTAPVRLTRRREATARALSNLGVLHALAGELDDAERNLRRAAAIGAWKGANRNLVRLETSAQAPRVARRAD